MPDVGIPGATEPEVEQMHPEPTTVADARAGNKEAVAFLEEEECYAAAGEFVAVIHAEFKVVMPSSLAMRMRALVPAETNSAICPSVKAVSCFDMTVPFCFVCGLCLAERKAF